MRPVGSGDARARRRPGRWGRRGSTHRRGRASRGRVHGIRTRPILGERRGRVGGRGGRGGRFGRRLGDPLEGVAERGRGRRAVARSGPQRGSQQLFERDRHVGPGAADGCGDLREAGEGDGALVGPLERHAAGEALGQDDRQRVEVGAPVDEVPLDLLWRDIFRSTEENTIVAELVDGEHRRRDAEVGEADAAGRGDEHVAGLDVAVHDAGLVGGVQRVGQGDADAHHLVDLELGLLVEHLAQRQPGHVLHDDGLVAALADGVVDGDDARVVDAGDGDGLAAHPVDEGVVGGEVRVEQLHRDLAVEDLVSPEPHLGHAADGDATVEPVAAGQPPWPDRRRRWRRKWGRGHGRCRRYWAGWVATDDDGWRWAESRLRLRRRVRRT